ncbi:hypothetical protein VNO77_32655 [Canavalia gladiata]|uniref:Uncharacterized protein n=1 Tax=Canavalia gladiata TaxID=3824 RepID=A0AAN9KRI7_CANGL
MKEEHPTDTLPLTITNSKTKTETSEGVSFGKGHYKFWLLAVIILLSLWSIFTASLSLKWSAPNLTRNFHPSTLRDLDVLEVEEREKVVKRMWDVYTHSSTTRLPRFWYDAFDAAYEHLVSDVPSIRDAAVSEIAKMSLRSLNLHSLPLHIKSDSLVQNIRDSKKNEASRE